jgi:hypothetical protein
VTSASGGQRSIQLSYGCTTVGIVLCLGVVVQPQTMALVTFALDQSKFEQLAGYWRTFYAEGYART